MIKRVAAAGAAAWTAPVIIDSLASPAAATTVPCGCYKAVLDASCTLTFQNNNDCSPPVPSGECLGGVMPQNDVSANYVPSDFCISLTTSANTTFPTTQRCNFRTDQYAFVTIGSDCNCVVLAAEGKVVGRGGCETQGAGDVIIQNAGKRILFDKGDTSDLWKSFTFILRCC